jgi:uncharacterized membrane protein YfcA
MRTTVAIGTSLLQITVVSAVVTLLHAITTHTVDALLALILAIGGAIGAQIGVRLSSKLRGEELRFLLAVVVLSVGIEIGLTLVNTPLEPFSLWRAIE